MNSEPLHWIERQVLAEAMEPRRPRHITIAWIALVVSALSFGLMIVLSLHVGGVF